MGISVIAKTATVGLGLAIAAAVGVNVATAATLAGLKDGSTIVWIDTETKKVVGSVKLANGAKLAGIDVRPADGKLYGMTADGTIVMVDHKSGEWEKKSQISEKLPAGATIAFDFNPAADRLRIITSTGISLRVNVDDGKTTVDGSLKYSDGDAAKGKTPKVTAAGTATASPAPRKPRSMTSTPPTARC